MVAFWDPKSRLFRDFRDFCDFSRFSRFSGFRKISGFPECQKKCENFDFSGPQNFRNFGLYAVGTTRRKWRQKSLRGGKKIALFRHFRGVKEKNVPFSAILSVFVISRFFSKSHGFEGQCQRGPPKGSPSCPVIFHRGGN